MTLADEVAALRAREKALLAERAALRRAWLPPPLFPHPRSALGLAPIEADLLACLIHRPQWSRDFLSITLIEMRGGDARVDPSSPRHVDVNVARLRARLEPYGVKITTYYGRGFGMPLAHRRALAETLEAEALELDAKEAAARQVPQFEEGGWEILEPSVTEANWPVAGSRAHPARREP